MLMKYDEPDIEVRARVSGCGELKVGSQLEESGVRAGFDTCQKNVDPLKPSNPEVEPPKAPRIQLSIFPKT